MVSRNYTMSDSEPSHSAPASGSRNFVETIRSDLQRSSRRSVSETIGTVRHGRFQYLGDCPQEASGSPTACKRVSAFPACLYGFVTRSVRSLQIQRSGSDSRRYQISREVVGLERGPLSLVSTTEELLGRKSSGSCLESREYGRRDPSR
jgi:hypothetical protein